MLFCIDGTSGTLKSGCNMELKGALNLHCNCDYVALHTPNFFLLNSLPFCKVRKESTLQKKIRTYITQLQESNQRQ